MTEQDVKATLQDMASLLANNLKVSLADASGPKQIQVVHRQLCTMEDLTNSDLLVAKAGEEIRGYLAAWPNVLRLGSNAEFTTEGGTRIFHQSAVVHLYPMPQIGVHHASSPTSNGKVDAMLYWNQRVLANELALSVTCSVSA